VALRKHTQKKFNKPLAKTTKLKNNLELASTERNKKFGILHGHVT
jgi:hypothetical protein